MKKFLAILVVLALTMISSVAMAEITFDGSIEFLMRSVKNVNDWNSDTKTAVGTAQDSFRQTYERVRFGVNAKHDGVKGRFQIENDWDTWADGAGTPGFETRTTNDIYFREAWLDFTIPGAGPAHIKVGRQFLQLGNGWFFRSGKYGSDAWVLGYPGKNTIAFVNVKVAENATNTDDDTDAYVLLDTYKLDDKNSVGAYIAHATDRDGVTFGGTEATLDNIGLHYNGVMGPVKIGFEFDYQMGEFKSALVTTDHTAWQAVLQATMAMDALTVNATLASGTGQGAGSVDSEEFIPFLDKDPHYTLVYEYFMNTAAGGKNTGFANTLAAGLGAMFKINKTVAVGADFWFLQANEDVALNGGTPDSELGMEIDAKLNLTLYDQLTWNTTFGYFMPGKAYENALGEADEANVLQSVLSYKF